MSDFQGTTPRALRDPLLAALDDFPVVLMVGARQVGKSTLAEQLVREGRMAAHHTLDDAPVLAAATADPAGFVAGLTHGTVIDEVQRAPDLLRAIKRAVDRDRRPGRFLLTGSANVLALPATTESLAGRAALLELEGFSLAELRQRAPPTDLLRVLLADDPWPAAMKRLAASVLPLTPAEQREAVFFGGFPEVVLRRKAAFHQLWFRSYLTMYVERDARDLTRIPDATAVSRLFHLIASASGQTANMSSLAMDARIDQRSAARYLQLLENTFHVSRLPPWFRNVRKRLVKTPKLYLRDSGLACHLLGIAEPQGLQGHPATGALCETWVHAELRKLTAHAPTVRLHFLGIHGGAQCDFVLEREGRLATIEVKSGLTVGAEDFLGTHALREITGQPLRGLVLYGGEQVVSFGDGLAAVPFGVLYGSKLRARRRRR